MENGLNYIFNEHTRVIVMGTFPSIKSRNICYYNNPSNQFWKIIANILNNKSIIDANKIERYSCLLNNYIGLWDVIKSCEFANKSSLDSKIISSSIIYNDFAILQNVCPSLECIVFNSKNAQKLYNKYYKTQAPDEIKGWLNKITNNGKNVLPSTSSANARKSFEQKLDEWKVFLTQYINSI